MVSFSSSPHTDFESVPKATQPWSQEFPPGQGSPSHPGALPSPSVPNRRWEKSGGFCQLIAVTLEGSPTTSFPLYNIQPKDTNHFVCGLAGLLAGLLNSFFSSLLKRAPTFFQKFLVHLMHASKEDVFGNKQKLFENSLPHLLVYLEA